MTKSMEGSKISRIINLSLIIVLCLTIIIPFMHILALSFNSGVDAQRGGVTLFPRVFSMDNYLEVFKQDNLLNGLFISIFRTVTGTILGVSLMSMAAYALTIKTLPGRKFISFFIFFTMLFNGGIVPSYIMWTKFFHIKNTIWALIIPNYLVSAFNVILVKNYYQNSVPDSLIEAAQLDGASELKIFFKVMLPLAVPTVATISLFTGICYWNDWTNGLYYISNEKLYSIQQLLMKIMNNIQAMRSSSNAALIGTGAIDLPGTSIRMAMAVIGILPIMLIYPFVQKYLVKGVVVGAVKG